MTFRIFLPPTQDNEPPPVLYWLSGLTCNDENFTTKAGARKRIPHLTRTGHCIGDAGYRDPARGEQVADDGGYDLGPRRRVFISMPRNRHRPKAIIACTITCVR